MKSLHKVCLLLSFALVSSLTAIAYAQVVPAPADTAALSAPLSREQKILAAVEKELKEKLSRQVFIPPAMSSLFFTPWQESLVREARLGFNTRAPTQAELMADPNALNNQNVHREVKLGGIVFKSDKDWTIWLNSQLVTPKAMPKEAVDLKVYKDFIELKWFDAKTNEIYPIRLRPNQRFHIDGKLFLPG